MIRTPFFCARNKENLKFYSGSGNIPICRRSGYQVASTLLKRTSGIHVLERGRIVKMAFYLKLFEMLEFWN